MINVKDQVYAALLEMLNNVSDSYPKDWAVLPAVQYMEEDNKVYEFTDKEEKSFCRYRVDIWDNKSTSRAALEKVQKLYDRYVEEGGDQMKLYTNVIMGIMAVSGFFTAEQAEAMEDKLEAATQQML